jgi:hypothetical protein
MLIAEPYRLAKAPDPPDLPPIVLGDVVILDCVDKKLLCMWRVTGVVRSIVEKGTITFPMTNVGLEAKRNDPAVMVQELERDGEAPDGFGSEAERWYLRYQSQLRPRTTSEVAKLP